jgi:hypothetical protein
MSRPRVKDADISAVTVLRAVHDLRDTAGPACTADEIAAYLCADPGVVLELLVDLKARRILRDHTRGTGADRRREWRRWGER